MNHLDQLAEHIAPLAAPLPHPPRYDHGYVKIDRLPLPPVRHPGPITMVEPRGINWGFAFLLGYLLAVAAIFFYFAWSHL